MATLLDGFVHRMLPELACVRAQIGRHCYISTKEPAGCHLPWMRDAVIALGTHQHPWFDIRDRRFPGLTVRAWRRAVGHVHHWRTDPGAHGSPIPTLGWLWPLPPGSRKNRSSPARLAESPQKDFAHHWHGEGERRFGGEQEPVDGSGLSDLSSRPPAQSVCVMTNQIS